MSMALGQGLFVRKETMIALTIERWIRWGHATSVRSGNVAMMLLKSEGKDLSMAWGQDFFEEGNHGCFDN